jgi:hypothetical protein
MYIILALNYHTNLPVWLPLPQVSKAELRSLLTDEDATALSLRHCALFPKEPPAPYNRHGWLTCDEEPRLVPLLQSVNKCRRERLAAKLSSSRP